MKQRLNSSPINNRLDDAQKNRVLDILNSLMKDVLNIGQCGLTKHQFEAFRRVVMDYFADARRELGQGRCGEGKDMTGKAVAMDE